MRVVAFLAMYFLLMIGVTLVALALAGCGGTLGQIGDPCPPDDEFNNGQTGDPCAEDDECEGLCLEYLSGEWLGEDVSLSFPGGMCTEDCDEAGVWDGLNICTIYYPSGERFMFPSCRNDLDCRVDEGYECTIIGLGAEIFWPRICLPPGA